MAKIWGWEYRTQQDERVRLGHQKMHGMRYPVGHSVWDTYMPPCDYGCRCYVEPIYEGSWKARVRHPIDFAIVPSEFSSNAEARLSRRRVLHSNGIFAKMKTISLAIASSDSFKETSPGVFRKELIYPGTFTKKDPDGKVDFRLVVDEKLIDHWVKTFNEMKSNGVDVPVPIEHSEDPEDRRGTVVRLEKEFNEERGTPALFAYVTFRKGSEQLAETSQVSLFSPPDMEDGVGNSYKRPITHVAITDYPLVPGLASWKTVAASRRRLASRRKMKRAVSLRARRRDVSLADDSAPPEESNEELESRDVNVFDVADSLGIEYDEDSKAEDVLEQIEDVVEVLVEQVEELGGELPDALEKASEMLEEAPEALEELEELPPESEEDLDDVTISSEELEEIDAKAEGELPTDDDEETASEASARASAMRYRRAKLLRKNRQAKLARRNRVPASASNQVARQLAQARTAILRGLVADRKITPAAASRLEDVYAKPQKIAAASRSGVVADDFEAVVAALSSNSASAFRRGSRTGAQQEFNQSNKTPLVKDAEARASRASKK